MIESHKLWGIEQAVELGTTLTDNWFRGHSKTYNELTPTIFRKNYDMLRKLRPDLEFFVIENFKREAPAYISDPPAYDDHISWLFLMQHHGAPTRLLDWTRNVLVALYFAVRNHQDEDGELWSIRPDNLNRHNGYFGKPTPINKELHYLAGQPSHNNPEALAEELGLKNIPKYPFAVLPPTNFSRLVNQMAAFTIHPVPFSRGTITELLTNPKDLVRYVIPKHRKLKLRLALEALGIMEHTLFPNLDSLSKSIVFVAHHSFAYGPPDPPVWKQGKIDKNKEGNDNQTKKA